MASLLHVEPVQRYLAEKFLLRAPERGRCVALTFDDGPNPRNTPVLLDLLARKGIRATFFVLGKRMQQFGAIARRAHAEGHELANHGYHHLPLPLVPSRLIRKEVLETERLIMDVTGEKPRFFRPPMGWFSHRSLELLMDLGYEPVIGNIHPEDSRQPPVDVLLGRIRRRLVEGSILILHDGGWRAQVDRSRTIEAVDRLTDELAADGYRFLTVGEMVPPPVTRPADSAAPPHPAGS